MNIDLEARVQGEIIDNKSPQADIMPRLIGDERRFKQVLINLLRNAFKFTS